jgi:tRNA U55 pseudouridine synthase TruB
VSTFSRRARTNWRPKVRFAPPIPKFQFSTASNASRLNLRTSQSVPIEILQLQESVIPLFLELQCVNEYETYLRCLIHEIGVKLHSTAHCTGIQCIRHSYFTLDNALLRKHWTLQHIVTNMEDCIRIMDQHENILKQKTALLQ